MALSRAWIDEILMNGESDQRDSLCECEPFEFLQVGAILGVHLAMQDVDPSNPQHARLLDDSFNRHLWRTEVPVRICSERQFDFGVESIRPWCIHARD